MSGDVAELVRPVDAVPVGWRQTTLGGALAKSEGGGTPPRDVEAYWNGDIPWASVKDVVKGEGSTPEETITPTGLTNSTSKLIPAGTNIFAARMGVGAVVRYPFPVAINQDLMALTPSPALDPGYLFYWLQARKEAFVAVATGTTVKGIRKDVLFSFPMELPPLHEQRRIAEVLRSVDDAIAATQRVMQAEAAVRQLALDAMIQRVLDDPETEVRPLSDIAEVRTGLAKNKNRVGPKVHVPYLRVANVQDGWFDLADMQDIEVDPNQIDRYLLQAGDVLLTEGGDYDKLGRGGVWHGQITPCLHQNHVFCVRPQTSALQPAYFALATQSAWGRAYFLTCAKRTTNLASINSSQLRAFPVPVVPIPVQTALIEEVAAIDAMIDLEERELETLLRVRTEVSSDLLSGRVRVPA